MVKVIFMLSICFLVVSCTSIPINTTPPGAKIFLDNKFVGISPCEISPGEFSRSIQIRIEKEGYQTIDQIISKGQDKVVARFGTNTSVSNTTANILYPTNNILANQNTISTNFGHDNYIVEGTWPNVLNFRLEKEEK